MLSVSPIVSRVLWWLATCTIAGGFAGLFYVALGFVGDGLFGGVIGVVQWLFLRRHFQKATLWILASFVGWFVGLLVGAFAFEDGILLDTAPWLGFGLAQSLYFATVIKPRFIPLSVLWVAASTLGGACAEMAISLSTDVFYDLFSGTFGDVGPTSLQWMVIVGGVYGVLTVPFLVLLIRSARSSPSENTLE